MKVYLARLTAEQEFPHEIVGIFAAEDLDQVFDLVDECTDADRVEVVELGIGGIYWSGRVPVTVPTLLTDENQHLYQGIPGGAVTSDHWNETFFSDKELKWQRVEWAD